MSEIGKTRSQHPDSDSFFLPDLCNTQSLLVLIILAELLALVVTSLQRGLWPMDWQYFSLVSLFCLLVFLSSAAVLCMVRGALSHLPLLLAASVCYALVLCVVALYSLSGQWLLSTTGSDPGFYPERLLQHLFIGAVVTGIGLRYLYLNWQLRLREHSEMQARIQALQSRIQPHFLFNSLNTIASLIDDSPREAELAVEDLAALFRANLQDSRVFSQWSAERDLCERYLRIESMRLGERLQVQWYDASIKSETPLLSLSLQPLLENAILHGIQRLPDGGCIIVRASIDGEQCCIAVENPLPDRSAAERSLVDASGNHLACDNLRHRLHSVYGDRGQLRLSEKDQRFRVEMRFPLVPEA
ncbi:sensor histidine kinase [Litorivivens sp.]|uniref:sensor histidine kinase n=1 Tax=Litorivivens sp. TaxID=2020868 RepID=UPI0035697D69